MSVRYAYVAAIYPAVCIYRMLGVVLRPTPNLISIYPTTGGYADMCTLSIGSVHASYPSIPANVPTPISMVFIPAAKT